MNKNVQILILAGGRGTRLRPLTNNIPKPMVKIGKIPFLEILITYLKNQGFKKFVLCVGYLSEVIENYFKDGKNLGIEISYSREKSFLGTAGAIKKAEYILENEFLVLNGDTFVEIDFNDFISNAKKNDKLCTIVGSKKSNFNAKNNLNVDGDYNVKKYCKTQTSPDLNYIDAGVYYFKKSILPYFFEEQPSSLEGDVFEVLIKMNQVKCYTITNPFYDIGTRSRVKKFGQYINKI